jgi:transposase-like protein
MGRRRRNLKINVYDHASQVKHDQVEEQENTFGARLVGRGCKSASKWVYFYSAIALNLQFHSFRSSVSQRVGSSL